MDNTMELAVVVEQSGLEKTKGQKLLEMFTPYFNRMAEIETKINGLNKIDPKREDTKIAREIRLALRDNRVASEKVKDSAKASILIEGRLIDNLNNIVKNTSKGLELQCEQIEKDAEIKEAARIESLRSERAELIAPYIEDANIFPLGTMTEDQFNTLLAGQKLAYQQKKEAEGKAEALRLEQEAAQRLEQERIREENARLKVEAEEHEKALAAERAETARLAKIESDKQEKIKKENEAKLKAAADEADRLQKELEKKQAREDAEKKRVADELKAQKAADAKAAKAPLKVKMQAAINALTLQLPESNITADVLAKFEGFKTWALKEIESL